MTILLYGPPGSGKSTVGKILSEKLGVPQIDTDTVFVSNHGDISDFIKEYGLDTFRDKESETLAQVVNTKRTVGAIVSLGGGTLLRKENVNIINQVGGNIVTLMGNWDLLFKRIQSDMCNTRPLAQNRDDFTRLMEQRISHYQSFYPRIPIDGRSSGQIANDIIGLL